ncbi:sodium-dependent transporter [Pyrococcus abyssi]|uniref:Uncharacterized protein n=1 Tax=Pyrococcus abyssi (strain GE5 / Orsay) TaxID=272844 RepID=Q9V0M1_PYRAB|nr:sodium-dependent transporter [Pyrococcus abyssi]CAB49682.1 Hypothetical protein PAB1853 [Pyrococcus abyssi GE5]CCE70164.1 TPA: hypothetical protein PAB1853 [Pyrococcus abyssi GE5]
MAKRTVYFVFIFIAYTLGIWTFTLIPRILVGGGLTALALLTVASLIIGALVTMEVNEVKNRPYKIHEFMTKFVKMPAISLVLLSFVIVVTAIDAHYTGLALSRIIGAKIPFVGIVAIILALALLIGMRTRSLDFIVGSSILTMILIMAGALFLKRQADMYIIDEIPRLTVQGIIDSIKGFTTGINFLQTEIIFMVALLVFGLGVGFYYVIGGPLARLGVDVRKVVIGTIGLQLILSIVALLTVAYSIGIAYQGYWNAYSMGSDVQFLMIQKEYWGPLYDEYIQRGEIMRPKYTIESLYSIPNMLRDLNIEGSTKTILALMGSFFLAGFTTLLVLLETGGQLVMDVFQVTRRQGILWASILSSVMAILVYFEQLRMILLGTLLGTTALIGLVEFLPVIKLRKSATSYILAGLILLLGIGTIAATFQFGGYYRLGILVGLMLLLPLGFNNMLLKTKS